MKMMALYFYMTHNEGEGVISLNTENIGIAEKRADKILKLIQYQEVRRIDEIYLCTVNQDDYEWIEESHCKWYPRIEGRGIVLEKTWDLDYNPEWD